MGGLSDVFGDFGQVFDDIGATLQGRETENEKAINRFRKDEQAARGSADRAQRLFDEISKDETISEQTRKELLFGFSELDPDIFRFTGSDTDTGAIGFSGDLNPNLTTPQTPFLEGFGGSLVSPIVGRSSLSSLQETFDLAREGKDAKFKTRQVREFKNEILRDQPGSRQFLIDPPKRQTLVPKDKETLALPSLLGRKGR